jgi:hypothetical protein
VVGAGYEGGVNARLKTTLPRSKGATASRARGSPVLAGGREFHTLYPRRCHEHHREEKASFEYGFASGVRDS